MIHLYPYDSEPRGKKVYLWDDEDNTVESYNYYDLNDIVKRTGVSIYGYPCVYGKGLGSPDRYMYYKGYYNKTLDFCIAGKRNVRHQTKGPFVLADVVIIYIQGIIYEVRYVVGIIGITYSPDYNCITVALRTESPWSMKRRFGITVDKNAKACFSNEYSICKCDFALSEEPKKSIKFGWQEVEGKKSDFNAFKRRVILGEFQY